MTVQNEEYECSQEQLDVYFDEIAKFKKRMSKVITRHDSHQVVIFVMLSIAEHYLLQTAGESKKIASEMAIQWAANIASDLGCENLITKGE
ncbi:MAG: hypothetical protein QX198_17000 [Methylococcaceae bacterium]